MHDDKKTFVLGAAALAAVALGWALAFLYAPVDRNQGEVYRIIFLHVPSAITTFTTAFALLVFSILGFIKKSESSLRWSKATSEVGLLMTLLTLATGSIWGKPTWGVWWTWDARLTTTFILALLYAGWLLLYTSLSPGRSRVTVCAVLGILIAADVPIIYKSVTWWRTLHQPPSMLRPGGATMDPEILNSIIYGLVATILYAAWMIWARGRNLALKDELEGASYQQMRG
jgi:heme exporter protein C